MNTSKHRGFTLIELVVVITILGILAAFAVPRFVALDGQARAATVNALAGSAKSAATLARSMYMANGGAAVTMEGATITMSNSYPDGSSGGIAAAVNSSTADFTYVGTAASGVWTKVGATTPASCIVTYTAAASGAAPTVTPTTSGC